MKHIFLTITTLCIGFLLYASGPLHENIGKADFSDWMKSGEANKEGAIVLSDSPISYRYPDGLSYNIGFRKIDRGVSDWSKYYGISIYVFLPENSSASLLVKIKGPVHGNNNDDEGNCAEISLAGAGWHQVILPWNNFNFNIAQKGSALQSVKEISIQLKSGNNKNQVLLRQVQLTKGEVVSIETSIKGKSVPKAGIATYELEVGNTSDQKQSVHLKMNTYGWESMTTNIQPASFELSPNEIKSVVVTVKVTDRIPAGGRETQKISAIANGRTLPDATVELITVSQMPMPNILHTEKRWNEVRDKVKHYEWAKKEKDVYIQLAEKWQVPELAANLTNDNPDKGQQLFQTQEEFNFMAAGISYQLTGEKKYAEKVALFLRRLSDPVKGYPKTFRACHQSFVQEGHFFQHIVMAYDMVAPSGVFTKDDLQNIENTFRLYIETVDLSIRNGNINNWILSEETGALYCALAIQDWTLVESIFNGPCGIVDHLANGVMNDGWWYECSIGYNVWCSSEFSQAALALEPWGVNFKDMRVPAGTTPYYSLTQKSTSSGIYGINFNKWGPTTKNSVGIKDMWDALPSFTDYRGVMFAVNDAQETMVADQSYELAYYLYRDPEYAAIIRRGKHRDLLYGVPDLPDTTSILIGKSAYADNMGIVMLRSNKLGRPQNEQIQSVLHYGTHGGFHGHFDRTNLLNITRYGRSFYNPEMIWYGYPSYMYKFYVQTSMSKNMVVVDQKMQEAVESYRTLFFSGKVMQATVVETKARWSNPPYGGMQYDYLGGISFAKKIWQEGRSIPIPAKAPGYGAVTDYTEPIFQRRLMVVTDDYIVVADYVKGEKEHEYDWLLQAKGFQTLEADKKLFVKHTAQMNPDPVGSAQFITDCNWWSTEGTTKAAFSTCWGKDCDNAGTRVPNSEDGKLQLGVYNVWPKKKEIIVATAPEDHNVNKQVFYAVKADGKILLADSTGAWILGSANIDLPLNDIKELNLELSTVSNNKPSLFWGNARIVLDNGKEVFLSDLPYKTVNVKPTAKKGVDYFGGPIKIAGELMKNSVAAMPEELQKKAIIIVDLSKLKVVRLKVTIGSDYPLGDESPRRKTYTVRTKGKEAIFLTVIEPFENKSFIKKVLATNDNTLVVELSDGRVQQLEINNLKVESAKVQVRIVEKEGDKIIREEKSL